MRNILPVHQHDETSLPRSNPGILPEKELDICLQVVQQAPRHTLAGVDAQVRIAGPVSAHSGARSLESTREVKASVRSAVLPDLVTAGFDCRKRKWGSIAVELDVVS